MPSTFPVGRTAAGITTRFTVGLYLGLYLPDCAHLSRNEQKETIRRCRKVRKEVKTPLRKVRNRLKTKEVVHSIALLRC